MSAISIGMPIRNGTKLMRGAIDSLLAQDFGDFELLIADNASDDETEAVCREYQRLDKRIRYMRNETNIGVANNFNLVFQRTSADLFCWAAHDDLWEPTFLSRCHEALEKNPDAVLAHVHARLIDREGRPIEGARLLQLGREHSLRERFIGGLYHAGVLAIYGLLRRAALARTRLFQPNLSCDVVMLAEMALQGPFECVPETLWSYRTDRDYEPRYFGNNARRGSLGHRGPSSLPLIYAERCARLLEVAARAPVPLGLKLQLASDVGRWFVIDFGVMTQARVWTNAVLGRETLGQLRDLARTQRWYRRLRKYPEESAT